MAAEPGEQQLILTQRRGERDEAACLVILARNLKAQLLFCALPYVVEFSAIIYLEIARLIVVLIDLTHFRITEPVCSRKLLADKNPEMQ